MELKNELDYSANVIAAANQAGIDPNLALAVMQTESSGNPNAVSPVGAVGLFQLMPSSFPGVNINDPITNIDTGVNYLASLLNQYGGDTELSRWRLTMLALGTWLSMVVCLLFLRLRIM